MYFYFWIYVEACDILDSIADRSSDIFLFSSIEDAYLLLKYACRNEFTEACFLKMRLSLWFNLTLVSFAPLISCNK